MRCGSGIGFLVMGIACWWFDGDGWLEPTLGFEGGTHLSDGGAVAKMGYPGFVGGTRGLYTVRKVLDRLWVGGENGVSAGVGQPAVPRGFTELVVKEQE